MPLSYQIGAVALVIVTYGILYPLIVTAIKWIKAVCHPIPFSYKHVLITGCGSGLGKALVQEMFIKGCYITMISRDGEKIKKVAESVDVSSFCVMTNMKCLGQ